MEAFLEGKGACTKVGAVSSPASPVSRGQGWGSCLMEEMHPGGSGSPKFSNQSAKASFPKPSASLSPPLPLLAWPQILLFLRSFYLNLLLPSPPPKLFGNLSTFFQVFPGQFGVRLRVRSGCLNTPSWVERLTQ